MQLDREMMMKRRMWMVWGVVCLCGLMAACDNDSDDKQVASDVPVALTDEVKARGYQVDGERVTFIVDEATQKEMLDKAKVSEIKAIDLRGTFTAWAKKDGFDFNKSVTDPGIWYLTQPLSSVSVPGNSGHPEFKFVVTGTVEGVAESTAWLEVDPRTPLGYYHFGNHVLTLPTDNLNAIIANHFAAESLKTLADFNLATEEGRSNLSNFRRVPGAGKLYRGYHPFKKSYPALDTETPRIALVNQSMADAGIKSVVTLSGKEDPDAAQQEFVTPYMQSIMNANHNLLLSVSYNSVYFRSDSAAFGQMMQQIINFIIDPQHEAPFMVHCRLGTDRTGVIVGVLAALAGTPWPDIAADYQRSNNMGIREFRDYRLLQYSFERMLKLAPGTIETINLQQAMTDYFISNGYFNSAQLDALVAEIK